MAKIRMISLAVKANSSLRRRKIAHFWVCVCESLREAGESFEFGLC